MNDHMWDTSVTRKYALRNAYNFW